MFARFINTDYELSCTKDNSTITLTFKQITATSVWSRDNLLCILVLTITSTSFSSSFIIYKFFLRYALMCSLIIVSVIFQSFGLPFCFHLLILSDMSTVIITLTRRRGSNYKLVRKVSTSSYDRH